jgi:hypothetical protein
MRRRSCVRVGLLLSAALVIVTCGRSVGTVSLVNQAEEPISRATITMSWGETLEVRDLNPAGIATMNYDVREGDYRIEVVFRSGKRLTTDTVYVTPGFSYQDRITVTPSEIQLTHVPADPP